VVEGDGAQIVTGLAGLKEARPGDVTFLGNPRYARLLETTTATAALVAPTWRGTCRCVLIRVPDPDRAFTKLALILAPQAPSCPPGVHPTAVVAPGATLTSDVSIGPYCVIESEVRIGARTVVMAGCYLGYGTQVGEDCRLYPHVTTREFTRIGNRTIIHNGAVIGSDGFGYTNENGVWRKIPQVGVVEIGDDVEIGANVTIDRARFGKTVIGHGVKIDNLVQVAHNVRIGDHTAIAAQAGIAGSATIGRHVQIGGQAGITGHISVGDHAVIGAQSGVSKDTPPGAVVFGTPAMPLDKSKEIHAHIMRLPHLKQRITEIEKKLAAFQPPGEDLSQEA